MDGTVLLAEISSRRSSQIVIEFKFLFTNLIWLLFEINEC